MSGQPKLRIRSPAEYDRWDSILRFHASLGKLPVAFSVSALAVGAIMNYRELQPAAPEVAFALVGKELEEVADRVFTAGGRNPDAHYHIDVGDLTEAVRRGPPSRERAFLLHRHGQA